MEHLPVLRASVRDVNVGTYYQDRTLPWIYVKVLCPKNADGEVVVRDHGSTVCRYVRVHELRKLHDHEQEPLAATDIPAPPNWPPQFLW